MFLRSSISIRSLSYIFMIEPSIFFLSIPKGNRSSRIYTCLTLTSLILAALLIVARSYFSGIVCFPCAALCDGETGRIALYYGAADSVVGVAFTTAEEIVGYIKAHSVLTEEDRKTVKR